MPSLASVQLDPSVGLARQTDLSAEDLAKIHRFNCGNEPWEQWINGWITNASDDGVDNALTRGTDVWLFWNESNEFVGFGSLCSSTWPWPGESDPEKRINLIPALGVDMHFQGKPEGSPRKERYSWQILGHLIDQVRNPPRRKRKRIPVLGLYVDLDNGKAINFYRQAGFQDVYRAQDFDGKPHQGMALNLLP